MHPAAGNAIRGRWRRRRGNESLPEPARWKYRRSPPREVLQKFRGPSLCAWLRLDARDRERLRLTTLRMSLAESSGTRRTRIPRIAEPGRFAESCERQSKARECRKSCGKALSLAGGAECPRLNDAQIALCIQYAAEKKRTDLDKNCFESRKGGEEQRNFRPDGFWSMMPSNLFREVVSLRSS